MSRPHTLTAREPKRQRGRVRVAAIMSTGVEVFAEKGFAAATMTEIAARSGTAIASLYRFFPTKESLADALLTQYAEHALDKLAELRGLVAGMSLDGLARALVDYRLELQLKKRFAMGLLDSRGVSQEIRQQFRQAMLQNLADILQTAIPSLAPAKYAPMAMVILHTLKGVPAMDQEDAGEKGLVLTEITEMIRAYLVSTRGSCAE